jgi:aminoglycoside phosphotransferase
MPIEQTAVAQGKERIMPDSHQNQMQRALACLNAESGETFTLTERLAGKSGAWAVDSRNGQSGILKVFAPHEHATLVDMIRLVEYLQACGYPTPRPLHLGVFPDGVFSLQKRLPGNPMRLPGVYAELNKHELTLLLGVLDLHTGIAPT